MKSKVKINPKVQASASMINGSGKGLFAIVDIKKGSIIAEFKGKVRMRNEKTKSNNPLRGWPKPGKQACLEKQAT